jgi:ACS family hexuronate transporter-like MFS transporter
MTSTAGAAAATHRGRTPLRWIFAGLLLLASVLNYIDRQSLSILASTIQTELNITNSGYAAVLQCFLLFYTVMYLVSGRIADRLGTRLAEALFICWWCLSNMCTAFVSGVVSLGVVRSLLGIGEPGNFTAAAKAVSEWFPPKEKGIAVGLYSMGGTLGAAIAAPLIAFLALRFGWRSAFLFTGTAGLALAAGWYVLYRRPSEHRWLSGAERELLIREGVLDCGSRPSSPVRWSELFTVRPLWLILFSRMITDPLWYFYLFWFPKYLQDARGYSLADLGRTVWVIFVAADCGCLLGGWLSGYWIRRGVAPIRARLRVMTGAAVLLAGSAVMPALPGRVYPLLAASVFTFAHMTWMTNTTTLPIDLFSSSQVGSVQGVIGAGSSLGGFISSGLIGYALTHASYTPVYLAMSFLHPAALLFLLALLPGAAIARSEAANS